MNQEWKEEKRQLAKLFEELDTNKNGEIEKEEL